MSYPDLPDQDPKHWRYIAEGFDSIIFGWNGPESEQFNNTALRLFKQPRDSNRAKESADGARLKHVTLQQEYVNKFIAHTLQDVDKGTPYLISKEFIAQMAQMAEPFRPEKRIKESFIQPNSTICLLHVNHVPEGSFVIEIKPKWGFRPNFAFIPKDSIKRKVSRFQLLQRTKLAHGDIKEISNYEPEDLFSKDPVRIKKAVDDLCNCPQGFMKAFYSGKQGQFNPDDKPKLVDVLIKLPHLEQLLKLQRLDFLDIEGIEPVYAKAGNPTWQDFVNDDKISEGVRNFLEKGIPNLTEKSNAEEFISNLDQESARVCVAAFLVSQAAKDCSIMLTFKDHEHIENPSVAIIDMDTKLPQSIVSRYIPYDHEILENYLIYLGNK